MQAKVKTGKIVWKRVTDFEDYYSVSSDGKIYSHRRDKLLKPWLGTSGYWEVSFCVNGSVTRHSVHRVLATTFVDNPDKAPQVNHIDGNKLNNTVDNLEWVSVQENQLHSSHILGKNRGSKQHKSCLTEEVVLKAKDLISSGVKLSVISRQLGINYKTLYNIKDGSCWAWLVHAER